MLSEQSLGGPLGARRTGGVEKWEEIDRRGRQAMGEYAAEASERGKLKDVPSSHKSKLWLHFEFYSSTDGTKVREGKFICVAQINSKDKRIEPATRTTVGDH